MKEYLIPIIFVCGFFIYMFGQYIYINQREFNKKK